MLIAPKTTKTLTLGTEEKRGKKICKLEQDLFFKKNQKTKKQTYNWDAGASHSLVE